MMGPARHKKLFIFQNCLTTKKKFFHLCDIYFGQKVHKNTLLVFSENALSIEYIRVKLDQLKWIMGKRYSPNNAPRLRFFYFASRNYSTCDKVTQVSRETGLVSGSTQLRKPVKIETKQKVKQNKIGNNCPSAF